MYLSKLELNPRSREARRDLALPYELHRTLAHAFTTREGEDYRAVHGVLFRIESNVVPGAQPHVLVQSTTPPNWQQLPTNYLLQPAQCKSLSLNLSAGLVVGFRLVANPTKKVAREGQRQGKRVGLPDKAEGNDPTPAQQWLYRKGELCGFEVVQVLSEGFLPSNFPSSARQAQPPAKRNLPLYGVRFEGLLRVTDPALLTNALAQGIGSAKAFGFGLLSLARPIALGVR